MVAAGLKYYLEKMEASTSQALSGINSPHMESARSVGSSFSR